MYSPIDLTELIPRVHAASKANGWWDVTPNAGQQLMLVVSELAEALEADRNGKEKTGLPSYHRLLQEAELGGAAVWGTATSLEQRRQELFKWKVKGTVADEMADAYIRLCDFAGGFGVAPSADGTTYAWMVERRSQTLPENFGEALLALTRHISDLHKYAKGKSPALTNALTGIEALCRQRGIDLATHIDLKLSFNATRGTRHGGKAY